MCAAGSITTSYPELVRAAATVNGVAESDDASADSFRSAALSLGPVNGAYELEASSIFATLPGPGSTMSAKGK